tara:strand:- start:8695 stop:10116 length:1422 start_codon:yes stop_codon:yes gene_type:complete
MAININELFADIVSTPEQRQEKLLQQGLLQGQLLSSGLKGRVANLAPLAQMAGQLGVQRNEDLRRAVQPMMGIDPRSASEKMQEQLGQIDTSTPEGLLKAANSIQSVDPIRAAALRQAASEMRVELSDKERMFRRQDQADIYSSNQETRAAAAAAVASEAAARAREVELRAIGAAERDIERFDFQRSDRELRLARESELSADLENQRNTLADQLIEGGQNDLADVVRDATGMTSAQLTNMSIALNKNPDIQTTKVEMRGAEILRLNPDADIANPDAIHTVLVRTNRGRDPSNPQDQIGAFVSDLGLKPNTSLPRILNENQLNTLEDQVLDNNNLSKYTLYGNKSSQEIAQEIYDYQGTFKVSRAVATKRIEQRLAQEQPLEIKMTKQTRDNPSLFIEGVTKNDLRELGIQNKDIVTVRPITSEMIDNDSFPYGLSPTNSKIGDMIMTYPLRVDSVVQKNDDGIVKLNHTLISL